MKNYKTLEIQGGQLRFSAGHFTIFSATSREKMHGHNYHLNASITAALVEPGITFDYSLFRQKLMDLCQQLHSRFLLPTQSPYLKITDDSDYIIAEFNQKKLPFLKEDVLLLPLANITLEELSQWFLLQVLADQKFIEDHQIIEITIKVFNGSEHGSSSQWRAG